MKTLRIIPAVLLGAVCVCACQHKEDMAPAPEKYFPRVKTIITNNCQSCHSAVNGTWQGRPTSFDTDEEIVAANASIKASVADPASPGPFGNKRMPVNGELSSEEIATIVTWLEKGGRSTD